MLYAQNGSTDAKLRHDEHSKISRVLGGKSTVRILDLRSTVHARITMFARKLELAGEGAGRNLGRRRRRRASPETRAARRARAWTCAWAWAWAPVLVVVG